MKVSVIEIHGPCEPGVYASATVEVHLDENQSIILNDLLVIDSKREGLCVSWPNPKVEDYYGGGPVFVPSRELRTTVDRSVIKAYNEWYWKELPLDPWPAPRIDSCTLTSDDVQAVAKPVVPR